MKIIKGAITRLAREGRMTIQIPRCTIGDPGMKVETEEVPDEWIVILRAGCPAVGKEEGYSFLTKIGWEANKEKIKEVYENAEFNRGPWERFETQIDKHFKRVEKLTNRKIDLLEKKLEQLRNSM